MDLGSPRFDVAEELERAALAELHGRKPDRVLATNVEFWSAVVLDVADVPPSLAPAMFACSRTAGWSAHILEQKRLGRLVRPSAIYVGPGPRSLATRLMDLAQAAALADEYAQGRARARARRLCAASGPTRSRRAARNADYRTRARRVPRDRPVPLPAEARAAPPRASRTRARPCAARR